MTEHAYTRDTIIDRLAEIHQLLLTEGVKIGNLSQHAQDRVGAVVGDAISLLRATKATE